MDVRTPPLMAPETTAARRAVGSRTEGRDVLGRAFGGALDHSGWIATIVGAIWLSVVLFAVWPALRYPVFVSNSNIDSAFFAYAGELLRQGGTPYVTFWDHKPPLVFFIDAFGLTLSGGAVWGIWVVSLATLLVSLVLAHLALRRAFGAIPAALGVSVFAFTLPSMLASNLTEEYALPLQWGSVFLLVRWAKTRNWSEGSAARSTLGIGVVIGVLGGLAFALKANLIAAPLCVAAVIGLVLLRERRIGEAARFVMGALVGAGIVWGAIVAYVAARGAFAPFVDQVFHYNFLYAGTTWGQRLRAAVSGVTSASRLSSLAIPLAVWALSLGLMVRDVIRRADRRPEFALRAFGVLWMPVEVVFASISGRPYLHYFVVLLPPLAYLAASFAVEILRTPKAADASSDVRSTRAVVLVLGLAAAMALTSVLTTGLQLRDAGTSTTSDRRLQVDAAAAYVRTHTRADAPLLVWGHASDVYFLAKRRPASRYVYSLALLTPRYADSALVDGFIGELRSSAPPLIVDATVGLPEGERLVPSLGQWDQEWRYPTDQGPRVRWWSMTPALRKFYDFVASTYAVVDSVGPERWPVYRRRDAGTGTALTSPLVPARHASLTP